MVKSGVNMFLGTFNTNIMDKGRLSLPKKIREELNNGRLILTIGFEEGVFGFTEKKWEETTNSELNRPLFSDKEGRDLRRKMCAEAVNIELDSQGRFVMPNRMLNFCGLRNEAVIIGAGDHFEIWDLEKWEEYRKGLA